MTFPVTRLRRLRYNSVLRQMVTETKLSVDDFVMPLFVCSGTNVRNPISSMPGNYQLSVENLVEECKKNSCCRSKSSFIVRNSCSQG